MILKTNRLKLIPCQPSYLRALAQGKNELGKILNAAVPESWPQFPEAYKPPAEDIQDQADYNWGTIFFLSAENPRLIGSGGFKGGPDSQGSVELGYEIAPELWNQGYASEAVGAMLQYAFGKNAVQRVIAHTLGEENASNRVLRKNGFVFASETKDPEHGTIWQWRRGR